MREIKFRAWDKELKKIAHIAGLKYDRDLKLSKATCAYQITEGEIYGGDSTEPWDVELLYRGIEFLILMQFTGLNDSKGKEIYEGDIVDGINIDGETYPMGEVFFDSGCFCIKTKSCDHDYEPCLYEAWVEKIFIVGNIYETPNLLKGEKYGRRK